jgi:hypothetical protein
MHDNTPVLIGAGQFAHRGKAANAPTPLQLIKIAAEKAAADAGLGARRLVAQPPQDPAILTALDFADVRRGSVGRTDDRPNLFPLD